MQKVPQSYGEVEGHRDDVRKAPPRQAKRLTPDHGSTSPHCGEATLSSDALRKDILSLIPRK